MVVSSRWSKIKTSFVLVNSLFLISDTRILGHHAGWKVKGVKESCSIYVEFVIVDDERRLRGEDCGGLSASREAKEREREWERAVPRVAQCDNWRDCCGGGGGGWRRRATTCITRRLRMISNGTVHEMAYSTPTIPLSFKDDLMGSSRLSHMLEHGLAPVRAGGWCFHFIYFKNHIFG